MTRTLRAMAVTLAAILAATLGLTPTARAAGYSASAHAPRSPRLPVATEVRTGYNRDLFPHWIDADGDGCNTRYEVLIAEATTAPTRRRRGCTLSGGRWYSYYDNAYWTAHRPTWTSTTWCRSPRRGTPARATGPPAAGRRTPTTWATAGRWSR